MDYSQLVKLYGSELEGEKRYSPAKCLGTIQEAEHRRPRPKAHQHVLRGAPEPHHADEHAPVHAPD